MLADPQPAAGTQTSRLPEGVPRELKKYELLSYLATGGMSELYLARAKGLGGFERLLVIKRIRPDLAVDREAVKMFLDEARIAATLSHSNIVQVHDVDVADGVVFIAMEFLHGKNLRSLAEQAKSRGVPIPLDQTIMILLGVCAGLHYAHERVGPDGAPLGIVHRDVSPHNVMVTFDGGVKVIDFGVAFAANKLSRTRLGRVKGKLGYMSPEQCRGLPVDRRSDVYCAAILLYELTTGHRLFDVEGEYDLLRAPTEADPIPPARHVPGYPPALERIVLRGLSRDPSARHPTALELQHELEGFARDRAMTISPFGLARYMEESYADAIAPWRAAQRRGRTLAEYILSSETAQTPVTHDDRVAQKVLPRARAGRSRSALGWPLAIGAGLLAVALLAAAVSKRSTRVGAGEPSGSPPSREAPTAPGAPVFAAAPAAPASPAPPVASAPTTVRATRAPPIDADRGTRPRPTSRRSASEATGSPAVVRAPEPVRSPPPAAPDLDAVLPR